jgi:hypothetical protein
LTHVRCKLVAQYEEEVSKDEPLATNEGPQCSICGQEVDLVLVSPVKEETR